MRYSIYSCSLHLLKLQSSILSLLTNPLQAFGGKFSQSTNSFTFINEDSFLTKDNDTVFLLTLIKVSYLSIVFSFSIISRIVSMLTFSVMSYVNLNEYSLTYPFNKLIIIDNSNGSLIAGVADKNTNLIFLAFINNKYANVPFLLPFFTKDIKL